MAKGFGFSWLWVKNTGYPKQNGLVKGKKNIDQNLWSLGLFFLTHSLAVSARVVLQVLWFYKERPVLANTKNQPNRN